MSRQGALEDERGFTLAEVLATIIIMGIVFAIASSTWSAIRSRQVGSRRSSADRYWSHSNWHSPIVRLALPAKSMCSSQRW